MASPVGDHFMAIGACNTGGMTSDRRARWTSEMIEYFQYSIVNSPPSADPG